ncbi:Actophorin [Auxenochlorella protothecoides]|uniref:Actophorin n=1 Tax=Auxenochlorella protothecoides TaxID=3075 RepID=A0A087SNA1_AUXPR|nr:Actophorin [Auxenochlorella protothecoides]KFM27205.1 Actophorin [Auxenochlorella protothecoides]
MADPALQTLLSTKAALDLGLVTQADFDMVKTSFLRAQQLKAAVDVGVLREEDYEATKSQFLELITGGGGATPASRPQSPVPPMSTTAPPTPGSRAVQHDIPLQLPKIGGTRSKPNGGTSMSGIAVSDDAVNLYYHIRSKSAYRWALWRVDDEGTTVVISAVGPKDSTYAEFLAALPDSDCRYGVFDFQEVMPDGQVLTKLVFLNWAPDVAKVKAKMMYASTKDFFKGLLDGISVEFQASELDDVNEQEVADAVRALKRS